MERMRHKNRETERMPQDGLEPTIVRAPTDVAAPAPPDFGVQVISGASVQTLGLAGLRISQAREVLSSILQVHPRAPVLVNGREVPEGERLQPGDTLEFVHLAGEKGTGQARRLAC